MNAPNLFEFATKELSQDALISWLIAWAGTEKVNTREARELRQCGCTFLDALFSKWQFKPDTYFRTEILQQNKGIDVLVRVNDQHVLVIEDKTATRAHSNQLCRYRDLVIKGKTRLGPISEGDVFPIYLKTGNHSQWERKFAEEQNYCIFDRTEFLAVLETYKGRNDTLVDFRNYLNRIEQETNSFRRWTHDSEKTDRGWEGLYRWIEESLSENCDDRWARW